MEIDFEYPAACRGDSTGLVLFVELAVGADDEKTDDADVFFLINGAIIAGDVYAPASFPLSRERMIVEKRMERASGK